MSKKIVSNSTQPKEAYSSDRPISSKKDDKFNRSLFAERIANTIAGRKDAGSLVVGIYGVWGDGKTSLLNLMEETLASLPGIVMIKFNPWYFQSQDQLIRGFFATMAEALGKALPTRMEELGKILEKYGSIVSMASVSILGGVAQITPGSGLGEFGKQISTVELDELRRRLEAILTDADKKLVVLIDDIDRLDRHEIQAIFKLVKLSAGFQNTAYVLAFDDEVVADALGERYGSGDRQAGRSFLEKIIQVPLHLPPAEEISLRKVTFEGVDAALQLSEIELAEEQVQAFVRHFLDGIEIRLSTPRQAKRYANVLGFALPILKGEVHPIDQMLIEGMRIFYPKLYLVVRENPDVCLGRGSDRSLSSSAQKQALEKINPGFDGLDPAEQGAAKDLLQVLFPRLKGIFDSMTYGPEWDERWEKEKRISSDQYFHRYFGYGIPAGDVSDQLLDRFLEKVAESNETVIGEALREFIDRGQAPRLIHKLRRREETVSAEVAKKLILTFSTHAGRFPKEKGMWADILSTSAQSVFLISKLICRIPAGRKREELARQVIRVASPLPYAFECLRWLRTEKEEVKTRRILSEKVEEELGKILAQRVKEAAAKEPPYLAFQGGAPGLLWLWDKYGRRGAVAGYLAKRFRAKPDEVPVFLGSYVATGWGMDGLSHRGDFMRDNYDAVSKLIDPAILIKHLRSLYGAQIDTAEYYPSHDLAFEQRISEQFAAIHKGINASKVSPGGATK